MKQVNASMSAELAQILEPIRFQGDDVRERLVADVWVRTVVAGRAAWIKRTGRAWISEPEYRSLVRCGARMSVIAER